jgi:hypothetical protein
MIRKLKYAFYKLDHTIHKLNHTFYKVLLGNKNINISFVNY